MRDLMDEAIMNQFFSAMATPAVQKIARVTKHYPLSLYKARSKSAIVVTKLFIPSLVKLLTIMVSFFSCV